MEKAMKIFIPVFIAVYIINQMFYGACFAAYCLSAAFPKVVFISCCISAFVYWVSMSESKGDSG